MTWQRIDENTYIDDSLVTCAEYQLFIDEMREQGKFYQPDHWTSYQFPSGQAREPILGVRFSDGLAFCKWLTERDKEKVNYRPPTNQEAIDFPLVHSKKELMGYWLTKDFGFAWINPFDSKKVEIDKNTSSERKEYSARSRPILIDVAIFNFDRNSKVAGIDNPQIAVDNIRHLELDRNNVIKKLLSQTEKYKYESFTTSILFQEDILVLSERVAGRYSPYESIRLVKQLL
jgi:hypothetical protein